MRSSDTPKTDRQGPADWAHETPSDDQLSIDARERIARLLRHIAEHGQ
jgi:hypothetical protein